MVFFVAFKGHSDLKVMTQVSLLYNKMKKGEARRDVCEMLSQMSLAAVAEYCLLWGALVLLHLQLLLTQRLLFPLCWQVMQDGDQVGIKI